MKLVYKGDFMTIAYENLELIPVLLAELKALQNEVAILKSYKPDLRRAKEVYEFLGISRASLYDYIQKDILQEGVHYKIEKNKTIFIEEGIIDFKEHFVKHAKGKHESTKQLGSFMSKLVA